MDRSEFIDKITSHKTKLFGFAMKLTQNREDAADLMQETSYRALKNLSSFQPNSNFKAWITTIMRNTFINKYRKEKRRLGLENNLQGEHQIKLSATTQNEGESNRTVEELIALVNQLKEDLKRPFLLRYSGYKYEEIAEQLNISVTTVSKALKDYPDVSKKTKGLVKELAKTLNYKPNTFAVNLRTKESKTIGLIIPVIVHHFFQM